MIGQSVAHYRITEKLGEGGMGEVYRAHDTKLSRDVALKILPQVFAQDAQRMARFEREAQVLASLNHANIAQIYGIESVPGAGYRDDGQQSPVSSLQPPTSDPIPQTPDPIPQGTKCLVLELVEGETLQEQIARGPIPVDEALKIALQICEGLEAAHEKGIIHRDLKPANIKITPEGQVKILDFGLAKAMEGETPVSDLSHSPTITHAATEAGVILGTASYMSPEQARGKPVDKRTDIWAFGCVLFEMLSGMKPFKGETVSDVLASVLARHPDLDLLPQHLPTLVGAVLRRCLRRDQAERLHDIGDARIEIREALEEPDMESLTGVPLSTPRKRRGPFLLFSLSALMLVAGLAALLSWALKPVPVPTVSRWVIPDPVEEQHGVSVDISRDGAKIVYVGNDGEGGSQLFLRYLNRLESLAIEGTNGAQSPFFSPDGDWVGFFVGGKLRKVSLRGGTPVTVCDAGIGYGGTWTTTGEIIFASSETSGLFRVSAEAGSVPEMLKRLDSEKEELGHFLPNVSEEAGLLLYTTRVGNRRQIRIQSLFGMEQQVLPDGEGAHYLNPGYLAFHRQRTLWIVPFDPGSLEVAGPAVPAVDNVHLGYHPNLPAFSVSQNGTLVYVSGRATRERTPVWVSRSGQSEALTDARKRWFHPILAPDGLTVVAVASAGGELSLWALELETGRLKQLTRGNYNGCPVWTPDGKSIIFASDRAGPTNLFSLRVDGSSEPERLTSSEKHQYPKTVSPDGKLLVFQEGYDLMLLALEPLGEPKFLLSSNAPPGAAISPDGEWLAYSRAHAGESAIIVTEFPRPGEEYQISTGGGRQPLWAPDGRELFYRNRSNQMVAVPVTTKPSFEAGEPEVLFEGDFEGPERFQTNFDISADGQRFLLLKNEEGTQPRITVVQNWFEELKRLVPTE